jgi:CBS domain containing-hemolysin-like protein
VVVGKMRVQQDSRAFLVKLDAKRWRVSGSTRLDDFRREYDGLGEVSGVETLGGLLVRLIESVPVPGESATFRGLKLTAHVTDARRVKELLVEQLK